MTQQPWMTVKYLFFTTKKWIMFQKFKMVVLWISLPAKSGKWISRHLLKYEAVPYIFPTSNLCERFFSKAVYLINSRRQCIFSRVMSTRCFWTLIVLIGTWRMCLLLCYKVNPKNPARQILNISVVCFEP